MDSDSIGETLHGELELLQMQVFYLSKKKLWNLTYFFSSSNRVPETFRINDCRLIENEVNVKLEY